MRSKCQFALLQLSFQVASSSFPRHRSMNVKILSVSLKVAPVLGWQFSQVLVHIMFSKAGSFQLCNSMSFFYQDCQLGSRFTFHLKTRLHASNTKLPLAMLPLVTFQQLKFHSFHCYLNEFSNLCYVATENFDNFL
jgi:hypothetical protein